nr:MAG TPA: hypothetical protein [Caudoviricetes sp.]
MIVLFSLLMFEDIVCENNVFCFYLFMMIDFFKCRL